MEPAIILTLIAAVIACAAGWYDAVTRARRAEHQLRYQQRMAEQWWMAYRSERRKRRGEWWQEGEPFPEYVEDDDE